jgi:RNA polymerase sigma-70 factor, ECF subfamily
MGEGAISNLFLCLGILYIEDPHHERSVLDEKQAITQLKRGDLSGLKVLVEKYQIRAVRAAALIIGERAQAEDIVQNAFIRAAQRIGQFDDNRPFGPWFMRSVVHDAIKSAQRQKRFVPEDQVLDLADPTPLPETLVESRETRMALWSAICQLPPKQRAAIVMRYYLDMREDEMSVALHGPPGTVKWWLHAARQRLARLLKSTDPVQEPDSGGKG